MVLTDKDFVPKKPIVKKPRTLNPLGAFLVGLSMGGGQALIYKSFIETTINVGFSALGIFLTLLAATFLLATLSLSGKYVSFTVKLEGENKKSIQTALQIMYFYIGFIPIYGFTLVYSISSGSLDFWKILVVMGVFIVFFVAEIFFVISLFYKKEISLGDLKEPFFQPELIIMMLICIATVAISTILLVFM
ncbi:MAG: hypothetical protein KAQ70_03110 [Candidatus Heimdallarchaeota archaeon]|nr:hypothetical protein [Candidatus Heimdallarchaeota archaeon]